MYASFSNHFPVVLRFLLAFSITFVIWPRFIFDRVEDRFFDSAIANFIKMVLLIIVTGYILVIIKLFEMIMILFMLSLFTYLNYLKKRRIKHGSDIFTGIQLWTYDLLDGVLIPSWNKIKALFSLKSDSKELLKEKFSVWEERFLDLSMFFVFIYSAYIRLYDAFINAAPPLSDFYTVLSWAKHISDRVLFFEGGGEVYPRGFVFYLQILQKFSLLDDLYVIRYAGPLNCVFITLSIYFVVSRMTYNRYAGVISAMSYGMLGFLLKMEWERQAAANSQEFALIFALPVVYYFYRYMQYKSKAYLFTAVSGLIVIGFVHTLVFAFVGMCMGVLIFYSLITDLGSNFKACLNIAYSGITAIATSIIPLIIGALMGIPPLATSTEFLVRKLTSVGLPDLNLMDILALTSIILLILFSFRFKKEKGELQPGIYMLLISSATFFVYYFGGAITNNVMLSARSGEFWALMEPVAIGFGWHMLSLIVLRLRTGKLVQTLLLIGVLAAIPMFIKPSPIIPYKMEWNSKVEQYLEIRKSYLPKSWMIVSDKEGYAISLGKGFHMFVEDFISGFDRYYGPDETFYWIYLGNITNDDVSSLDIFERWRELPENIFIYQEKNIYKVSEENSIYELESIQYKKKEELKPKLGRWVDTYMKYNGNISVFYEDENLRVLHITKKKDRIKELERLWGVDTSLLGRLQSV